jgi:hypothetical protein
LVLTGMEILALPVLAGSSGTQHQTVVFVQQTQGGMEFRASIFPPALADSFTTQPPIRASVLKAKIGTALSASPAQEVSSGILTLIPANALLDSSGLAPAAWPALADKFGVPSLLPANARTDSSGTAPTASSSARQDKSTSMEYASVPLEHIW